jgi:26S proteasome regulatory subunit N2
MPVDPKMEAVIDKMFNKCFSDRRFKDVIGIALECRRLDKVKEAIEKSGDGIEDNLGYTFTIAQEKVNSKDFRTEVLKLLLNIYQKMEGGNFDQYKIAKCQFFLNLPEGNAALLESLAKSEGHEYLNAYQIAFDICEKENQAYQSEILNIIADKAKNAAGEIQARLNQICAILKGDISERLYLQFLKKNNHTDVQLIH